MGKIPTIIWLRYKLAVNRLRSVAAVSDLASLLILLILGGLFSIGLAVGLGLTTHKIVEANDEFVLRILFHAAFLIFLMLAIIIPIARGLLNQGIEVSRFLVFPISYRKLYAVTLGSCSVGSDHLIYYPGLIVMCLSGALPPDRSGFLGLGLVGLLVASYVIWGHTIALVAQAVLKIRGVKEAAAILGILAILAASLSLAIFDPVKTIGDDADVFEAVPALRPIAAAYGVLPPGRAATGLVALHQGDLRLFFPAVLWLLLWDFAGIGVGYFIFSRYHLGERGRARKAAPAAGPRTAPLPTHGFFPRVLGLLRFFPDEVLAVAGKELRYLLRSSTGKLNFILAPLLSVLAIAFFREKLEAPVLGMIPENVLLFGVLLYLMLLSSNFVNNSFAWEGTGVQSYFLHPVPLRRILAGKNLAILIYNLALFCLCLVAWSAFVAAPDALTLVSCVLFFGNAFLILLAAGNLVSIMFPVARDISSMSSSPSQTGMLLAFLSIIVTGSVLSLTMAIPALMGRLHLQPVFLAGLLAVQLFVYFPLLKLSARLLDDRREALMETLRAKS
ncbi:MAG: hypothetical protein GY856_17350 [bacterium]|nr:hypothetical protein [bacterium]